MKWLVDCFVAGYSNCSFLFSDFICIFLRRSVTRSDRSAEREKRLNANMIERRRMQNINSGFTSLKRLLPPTEKKQTKAAILQQAVQHLTRLQRSVLQLRESNNILRQDLAEERQQNLSCREQLDAFIGEKFSRQEFQGPGVIFSHASQTKGQPPTPPLEAHSERVFSRWSPVPYDSAVNSHNYKVFDLLGCRDSRKRSLSPVMGKTRSSWDGKVDNGKRFSQSQRSSVGACVKEAAPSYQEASGFSLSRDVPDAGTSGLVARGNNLHCIVDAINLIERS